MEERATIALLQRDLAWVRAEHDKLSEDQRWLREKYEESQGHLEWLRGQHEHQTAAAAAAATSVERFEARLARKDETIARLRDKVRARKRG